MATAENDFLVYVGTYTDGDSEGIYLTRLDAASGKLGPVTLAAQVDSPNFLAVHPTNQFLYAVSGIGEDPPPIGSVHSFAIDRPTGALEHLNQQPSGGEGLATSTSTAPVETFSSRTTQEAVWLPFRYIGTALSENRPTLTSTTVAASIPNVKRDRTLTQ